MMLTGAMVVISPGTSFQVLAGLLIAIIYMLSVLKIAPFLEDADDWLSFTTSVQLVLTLLMGLILKLNAKDYPENSVGEFLIGMQLMNFFIFSKFVVGGGGSSSSGCDLCNWFDNSLFFYLFLSHTQ